MNNDPRDDGTYPNYTYLAEAIITQAVRDALKRGIIRHSGLMFLRAKETIDFCQGFDLDLERIIKKVMEEPSDNLQPPPS